MALQTVEVIDSDVYVTIPDPDDYWGCPIYDGMASQAYKMLIDGEYVGYDDEENTITLVVTEQHSSVVPSAH